MDGLLELATTLQAFDALTIYAIGAGMILLCGLGVPIPEDVSLLTMGYMTYLPMPDGSPRPHAGLVLATVIAYSAVMVGDGIMFSLGRRFGMPLARRRPFSWVINEKRLVRARGFITKHGPKVLFAARFMPGVRTVVFFVCGTLGEPYRRFAFFDGLAALLSVPLFIWAGWYWGAEIDWVIERARHLEYGVVGAMVLITVLMVAKSLWQQRRERLAEAAAKASTLTETKG
jgi:membrane protein DedA with SNARE-associated domain